MFSPSRLRRTTLVPIDFHKVRFTFTLGHTGSTKHGLIGVEVEWTHMNRFCRFTTSIKELDSKGRLLFGFIVESTAIFRNDSGQNADLSVPDSRLTTGQGSIVGLEDGSAENKY